MTHACQCGSHKAPPVVQQEAKPDEHSFKAFEARHKVEERKNALNLELYTLNVQLRLAAPDSQQEFELEMKINELKQQLKAV